MGLTDYGLLRNFNGQLAFSVAILMVSQVNYGMDLAAFSTTQAMSAFERQFGVYDPHTETWRIEPYFLSLLNSLTYVGQVAGVLLSGVITRRWGRRASLWVMCFWAYLSAILLVTAQHKEQMLIGRVLNYIYLGQEVATIPVMQAELCPSNIRGFVVSTYQLGIMIGSLIMAIITYGTSQLEGNASFRIPLGLFFVVPSIVGVSIFFIPESPRWLLVHGRDDEAMASLKRYRRGRFSDEEILAEFQNQIASIRQSQAAAEEKGSFWDLWRGVNLKRTLIALGANVCLQSSGQAFISKYGPVFLKDIKAVDPFAMTCINSAIYICSVGVSMYLCDKQILGRRVMLISGALLQGSSLLVMAGIGSQAVLSHSTRVGISALFTISYVGWCVGWGPISHIITSEIPTTHLRDLTYTTASVVNVVVQFAVSFSIPYLLYAPYANLGPKVGFIFGSIALATIAYTFFCVPECRRMSLEEIDHLFLEGTPIRKFASMRPGRILPDADQGALDEKEKEKQAGRATVEMTEHVP